MTEQHIFNSDDFGFDKIKIGDLVTEEVAYDVADIVPPAYFSQSLIQLGEPHNYKYDKTNNAHRPTFETFKAFGYKIWQYCGRCFRGEQAERDE